MPNTPQHEEEGRNETRADWGRDAIVAAADQTNVSNVETAATAITDVLAYIAHFCVRAGLDPQTMFYDGIRSYEGDHEDGPGATRRFDGEELSLADARDAGLDYGGPDPDDAANELKVKTHVH